MKCNSDLELLMQYARHQSEEAFTTLVQRHIDLVYSVALRQVKRPQLAEEITQSVFADLARQAHCINASTPLPAWLHRVSRNTAVDLIRGESRRQSREQIAVQMNAETESTEPAWLQIEPLVDEALDSLNEQDRSAVLWRFFENQSLRQVGEQLGISEDAARKRISRALDLMRQHFSKHGISVGSSCLIGLLSTNAVESAPVALLASVCPGIASGSGIAVATMTSASATIAKTMALTQKVLVATAVVLATGVAIYQNRQVDRLERAVSDLRNSRQPLEKQLDSMKQTLATDQAALLQARKQLSEARKNEAELFRLRGQYTQMRNQMQANAELEKRVAKSMPVATEENISASPVPVTTTHALKTSVRIPVGHTLVTGGWQGQDGKRNLTLITTQSMESQDGGNQILVKSMIIEAPESVWQQLGLADIQNDSARKTETGSMTLLPEQFEKISEFLKESKEVDVLSAPSVSTLSGREAQVTIGETAAPGSTNIPPGIVLNLTPTLTADQTAVDLNLNLQVTILNTNR